MSIRKFIRGGSNWQDLIFIIIKKLLVGNNPFFNRAELMRSKNLDIAVNLSEIFGHKKRPKHPEETLQRVLQNMRDKGFIEFLGKGEYKLTKTGYIEMEAVHKRIPLYDQFEKVLEG